VIRHMAGVAFAAAMTGGAAEAATMLSQQLTFATQERQSAWGPGSAQRVSDFLFVGTSWSNARADVGGIVGSVGTQTVPNPDYGVWLLCRGATLGFGDCGSEPPTTTQVTVDTRTGAKGTISTSGRTGVQLDYTFDAGSVGAEVSYDIAAHVPTAVRPGQKFDLNPSQTLSFGALDAQSPTAQAAVSAVLDVDVDVSGQACAIPFGCTSGSQRIIDVNGSPEILGVTPTELRFADGLLPPSTSLTVPLADVTATLNLASGAPPAIPPSVFVDVNGFTVGPPPVGVTVDLANINVRIPDVEATGGLSDGKISAEGLDEILSVNADIDAIVPGVPVGGAGFSVGPVGVTLDAFDIEGGPTMSLLQQFDLMTELMVELVFDKTVHIDGLGLGTSWMGPWPLVPEIAVFEETWVTPVFSVDATLASANKLQFGAKLTVDLLKASLGIGPASFDVGPLIDFSLPFNPDFAQVTLYDDMFAFGGFNNVAGTPFMIAPVPLPPAVAVLAAALGGLVMLRRRARL